MRCKRLLNKVIQNNGISVEFAVFGAAEMDSDTLIRLSSGYSSIGKEMARGKVTYKEKE